MVGVAKRSLALSLLALIGMAASCLAADPPDADRASACVDMIMPGAPKGIRETMKRLALLERDSTGNVIIHGRTAKSGPAHTSSYDRPYDRYNEPGYNSYGSDAYGSHGDYDYHAPASNGVLSDNFIKRLTIFNLIEIPGDTASAELTWLAGAGSPDNGDGNYGIWGAFLVRTVMIKDADKKPYLTIQGDADNPDSVTVWGKLSDAGRGITFASTISQYFATGLVPDTFKIDPSPTTCYYESKCANGDALILEGTASVSHSGHTLENASLYELAGRSWFPKHPVKFVCTITKTLSGCSSI